MRKNVHSGSGQLLKQPRSGVRSGHARITHCFELPTVLAFSPPGVSFALAEAVSSHEAFVLECTVNS